MKKRFTNIDIDRFFRNMEKLDPIYDENKVHQIISSPSAMARLKGKPKQILIYTVMTTLFAIIIAAILWGPTNESLSESPKQQQQTVIQQHEPQLNETTKSIPESEPTESRNAPLAAKHQTVTEQVQATSQVAQEKPVKPTSSNLAPPVNTETKVSEPIPPQLTPPSSRKGDLKMVVADQEMLEKLGFQFINQSVVYSNTTNGTTSGYLYLVQNQGRVHYSIHNSVLTDTIPVTTKDFYLVAESYRSGIVKSYLNIDFNLEQANDTLFPIYCPAGLVNYEPNDIVLWFTITPEFIHQLPEDKKQSAKYAHKLVPFKKEFPSMNFIDYTPEPLVDSSRFIELTSEQLLEFGFRIEYDSTTFQTAEGYVKRALLCYHTITDSSTVSIKYTQSGSMSSNADIIIEKYKNNPQLSFITNDRGDFEYKVDNYSLKEAPQLIPVLVNKNLFDDVVDKDRVYWFTLSDKLFEALPTSISEQLQNEYNYFIADNKENKEEPDCYYLEECKNTLTITDFKVFPNPANNQVNVSFTLPQEVEGRLSLLDLTGREVQVLHPETTLEKGYQEFEINTTDVPEGIYMVALYSFQGVQLQRLIVSH